MCTVKLNLVQVIMQAAPQVLGADERALLDSWLDHNMNAQIVEIDLSKCVPAGIIMEPLDALVALANSGRKGMGTLAQVDIYETERGQRALKAIEKRFHLALVPID
jgi:hypothetical protein